MKIDPKLDDNPENAGKEATKGKKPKKATLAIVRNQHKKDGPPPPPPGNTGKLAIWLKTLQLLAVGRKLQTKSKIL